MIFVTAAIGNPYSKFAGGPYNKKPKANQPQESHLSPLLARGPGASVISLPVLNSTVYLCVQVCMCTHDCTWVHTEGGPTREKIHAQSLSPTIKLCRWMALAGHDMLYSLPPSLFLRAAREMLSSGPQKRRNVTGQLSRSTARHRGSVKDKTSRWSRETSEQEKEKELKRERELLGSSPSCFVPWEILSHQETDKS